ncbi:ATP-binding protein [Gammaproteobacteria bacterium]|nr:ATP-binding protein [Gammaproteobacteria bacterium]
MSSANIESSSETVLQNLLPGIAAGGVDSQHMFETIMGLLARNGDSEMISAYVGQLRASADNEIGTELDHRLLKHISSLNQARSTLEDVCNDLKTELQQLLSPPFFPARYLGPVALQDSNLVSVAQDGSRRVVALADNMTAIDLAAGDEVYLCHERNAVIAKAPNQALATGETATVARPTEDGRLVINDHDTETIVSVRADLETDKLRPGDLVLWDRGARIVLSRVEQRDSFGYEDIDDTPSLQLGGIDQTRDGVLARFIFRILHPELARDYQLLGNGDRRLLLQGAPGTGKTTLMRIIASEVARETRKNCRVVTVSGAELYSSYVGETERNIRRCFATLKDYDGPGIAFFDEIDAIGRVRGNPSGYHDDRFLGTLLAELEGMQRHDIAVIAATNRSDTLDPALRSRFSSEIVMPRPTMPAARQIFSIHLPQDLPFRPNSEQMPDLRQAIIDAGLSQLYDPNADNMVASLQFRDGKRREVAARELASGRLIQQICTAARATAFERHCQGGEQGISVIDMKTATANAIERLRNTLTLRNIKSYLPDIPQDLDIVEVEPVKPRIDRLHYSRQVPENTATQSGANHE